MALTREQEHAARVLIDRLHRKEKVSVLQGFAGTGKTFLLNYLIDYLDYDSEAVAFAAYTGTAAKILMRQGLNASTIHSLIYKPIMKRGVCVGFRLHPRESLAHLKLIVVDEFSMLPQKLLVDLMSFGTPLILVGDQFQLPPIGEANQFINSADAILTEPMRQALESPVFWVANEIRQGKNLAYKLYGDQVLVAPYSKLEQKWVRKDVKIIVGLNKTRQRLNLQLAGSPTPQAGHRIMFLKNDWRNMITNGTIADIQHIEQYSMLGYKINFKTEDGLIFENYSADFERQSIPSRQYFTMAYSVTCHKSQGATYDSPGLVFDEGYVFREDKYRWLYTAVTRFTGNHNLVIIR